MDGRRGPLAHTLARFRGAATQERRDFAVNTAIGAFVFFLVAIAVCWLALALVIGSVRLAVWIGGVA